MSYKDVLRVFKLERELTDNETALLNTLRSMSDSEREMLAETLGPPVKAKVSKPATKKFKKCDVCGVSRRAAHHRDTNHPDYHEFDTGAPKTTGKSARASGIAATLTDQRSRRREAHTLTAPLLCDYSIDGKVCRGTSDDAIHDKSMGYAGFHPFQSGARSAASSSSTGESGVSSEVETASV